MSDVNSEIEQLKQQLKDANNQTELANNVISQAKKIIKQLRQNEQAYKEQIKSLQIENETLKKNQDISLQTSCKDIISQYCNLSSFELEIINHNNYSSSSDE